MKKYLQAVSILLISFPFIFSTAFATTQEVVVANFQFTPSNFSINLGDTVLFTWNSGSHTTTSTTIPASAAAWNHSLNSSSVSFIYVPTVSGNYNYHCSIHTTMLAQFTVVCVPPDYSNAISISTNACEGAQLLMDATNPVAESYQWFFNGNPINGATNATFLAENAGAYSTIVSNSCGSDTTPTSSLGFIPNPQITIEASNDTICEGQNVLLVGTGGLTYTWSPSNDLSSSFGDSVTASPNSLLQVILIGTDFGGCSNADTLNISVFPIPNAGFSFTQTGNTINTVNTSTGATIYEWDFGDGFTTNNPSPSHTYDSTNFFTILLVATNAEGCSDTFTFSSAGTFATNNIYKKQSYSIVFDAAFHKINLKSSKIIYSANVKLYNISGKNINADVTQNSDNNVSISTLNLPSGIYIVELISKENNFIEKIFIE